jgi:hypothetical protein
MRADVSEREVRGFLERMAGEVSTPAQAPPEAMHRARNTLVRNLTGVVVVTSLVALAAVGGVHVILRAEPIPADESRFPPVARIAVDGNPTHVAFGAGGVWTAGNVVVRVDPRSGSIVSKYPSVSPRDGSAIAVAEGAVYVSGGAFDGEVIRIETHSGSTSRLHPGTGYRDPPAVAAGGGWAWTLRPGRIRIGDRVDQLIRIDPVEMERQGTVDLPFSVAGIAVLDSEVWLVAASSEGRGGLIRVDAAAPSVSGTFEIDAKERVAAGFGSVWATSRAKGDDASVLRIDPLTGQATARIAAPTSVPDRPTIAVGDDAVWIGVNYRLEGELLRVDPATNEIVGRLQLDAPIEAIAAGGGAVWVVDGGGSLFRVDADAVST